MNINNLGDKMENEQSDSNKEKLIFDSPELTVVEVVEDKITGLDEKIVPTADVSESANPEISEFSDVSVKKSNNLLSIALIVVISLVLIGIVIYLEQTLDSNSTSFFN